MFFDLLDPNKLHESTVYLGFFPYVTKLVKMGKMSFFICDSHFFAILIVSYRKQQDKFSAD